MSLTSCFKYSIELPETTLSQLLRSVLSQEETVPAQFVYHEEDVPVGEYLVTVDATLEDSAENPSSLDIAASDLDVRMNLFSKIDVTVQNYPGLNPILYEASFSVPGEFALTAETPPWLAIQVGTVAPADLALNVTGGAIDFTPTVFEGPIHEMYAANEADVDVIVRPENTIHRNIVVTTEDTDINPITVEVPLPNVLRVHIPGTIAIRTQGTPSTVEYEGTLIIHIDIAIDDDMGAMTRTLTLRVGSVPASAVTLSITWDGAAPLYEPAIHVLMPGEVAELIRGFGDQVRTLPGHAEVQQRMEVALAEFVSNTQWKMIPLDGGDSEFPLSTAQPQTINADTLVLKIESEPSVPCDTPDNYVPAGAQVATAIGPLEVQRRLDAAADRVTTLPSPTISGYDVTLHEPSFSLENPGEHGEPEGHIWVHGTAVVHVGGCVGDVDAEYEGAIMLDVATAPNGEVNFTVRPGNFTGENEKDKKEDIPPDQIASYLSSLDWDFPRIPTRFEGLGEVALDFNTCSISRAGIVLSGGVMVTTNNALMRSSVLPKSAYWANP